MVVLNDLWSAREVIKPFVRVATAMPSDGNCCHPRARALHVQCQLWHREQLGPRAPSPCTSIPTHPRGTQNGSQLLECALGFNHDLCVCWKLPFVCATQNTRASMCKSRFLLDQMEKICLISLYSASILLREHAKYLL